MTVMDDKARAHLVSSIAYWPSALYALPTEERAPCLRSERSIRCGPQRLAEHICPPHATCEALSLLRFVLVEETVSVANTGVGGDGKL